MRYPASEKLEIIGIVERSHLPVKQTLAKIGVSRPTFYRWYDLYRRFGEAALEDRRAGPKRPAWNRIPDDVRGEIIAMALDKPELSPRELAMKVGDVTDTLEMALAASGLDQIDVRHRPRLLSDNGSSYVARDLADWMSEHDMRHVRGAPYHPMTQGKIERWHQTLKNRILLEHYYLPGDLETQIDDFVSHYNQRRYHESLGNLTPADVYFGRGQTILLNRERIKRNTFEQRRLHHERQAA
jgi:transposase InsO family protein